LIDTKTEQRPMYHCNADRLARQIDAILAAWGMAEAPRRDAVAIMVETDLRGIDSHGVAMLQTYDTHRKDGRIRFDGRLEKLLELPAIALFDAHDNLGHHAAIAAMDFAVAAAAKHGIAAAGVRHSMHFGAAGPYAERAVKQGLIGMALTNVGMPFMVPTHAAEPMFGTNPIAFAAPARRNQPFLLDMATTTVAVGKINVAQLNHRPLPPGWALDENGQTITDAAAAWKTRLLTPLGGILEMCSYKGYGLAAMVEILCATLTGAAYGPTRPASEVLHNVGHFFLAIDPRAFRPEGGFEEDMDAMIDALHAARRKDPATPILIPGEREYNTRAERLRTGIPIPEDLRAQVRAMCEQAGIAFLLTRSEA
jgi:LDH2 family malate/lactate/ureidoglycolate dehydrogenase